jgi:predicted RNA-binding protein YlqC (UPF0109 family)
MKAKETEQGGRNQADGERPLRDLIAMIAEALVDDPDSVDVQEIDGDHNSLIELRVAQSDIGKVIGKEGRTAQSMRTILTATSTKLGRRAHLDIVD